MYYRIILSLVLATLLSACTNNNSNRNQCGDTGGFGGGGTGGAATTTQSTRLSGSGGFGGFGLCPPSDCDPAGAPAAQKAACDDADPTTIDRCVNNPGCGGLCLNMAGQCDALDPQVVQLAICNDAETCTADRCDALNVCAHDPSPDGTPCSGGLCENGICTPTCAPECPTNTPCKLNLQCASNACVGGLCT